MYFNEQCPMKRSKSHPFTKSVVFCVQWCYCSQFVLFVWFYVTFALFLYCPSSAFGCIDIVLMIPSAWWEHLKNQLETWSARVRRRRMRVLVTRPLRSDFSLVLTNGKVDMISFCHLTPEMSWNANAFLFIIIFMITIIITWQHPCQDHLDLQELRLFSRLQQALGPHCWKVHGHGHGHGHGDPPCTAV